MTLIAGVKGDEFYITMNCGAQAKAKELGVTLDFQGPEEFDAALQTPIVNAVAAKKPDAVLIAPTDTKALYAPIKQIADDGTKVVLVDTTLEQPDMAVSQIASDNEGGGETGGQGAGRADRRQGQGLRRQRQAGHLDHRRAREGLRGGRQGGRARLRRPQYSNDEPEKAAAKTKAALQKNPDLKGIFGTNLFSAEGAASGVREAGNKDVKIVGFDAGPKQVKDLKDGTVQALIAQKPADIGAQGVQQAYNALRARRPRRRSAPGPPRSPRTTSPRTRTRSTSRPAELAGGRGAPRRPAAAGSFLPVTAELLLGLDLGTTSCKAAVVTREGEEVAHGQAPLRLDRGPDWRRDRPARASSSARSRRPARRSPARRRAGSPGSACRAWPRPGCCSTATASRWRRRSRGTTRAARTRPRGSCEEIGHERFAAHHGALAAGAAHGGQVPLAARPRRGDRARRALAERRRVDRPRPRRRAGRGALARVADGLARPARARVVGRDAGVVRRARGPAARAGVRGHAARDGRRRAARRRAARCSRSAATTT